MRSGNAVDSYALASPSSLTVARFGWTSTVRPAHGSFYPRFSNRSTNLLAFVTAAFFEIAGCFAFWLWLRRGASPLVTLLGVVSLIAFAFTLTRVDSVFAGRAYAAYGGIYIVASLLWLWLERDSGPVLRSAARVGRFVIP